MITFTPAPLLMLNVYAYAYAYGNEVPTESKHDVTPGGEEVP